MNGEEADFYSLIKGSSAPSSSEVADFYSLVKKPATITTQPIAQVEEQPKSSSAPNFFDKVKDYFSSGKLGEAASMQMKSGGFASAPTLEPKVAKKVATEVATIAAVEAGFAPIYGAAAAARYAPRVLKALTRLTQAATTGAATATASKLVDTGELPSQEELVKNGLEWAAVDAIMQALHVTASGGKYAYDFGKAVNSIAKKDNLSRTQVLTKLWDSTKNYIRQRFGKNIAYPKDIKVQDVEALMDQTKKAEKEGLGAIIEIEPVVEKPVEPIIEKPVIPKTKPTETLNLENIDDLIQSAYKQDSYDKLKKIAYNKIKNPRYLGIADNAIGLLNEFKIREGISREEEKKLIRARQLLEQDLKSLIQSDFESVRDTFAPIVHKRSQTLRRLMVSKNKSKVVEEQPRPKEKPTSGYERKPIPETVDEKISHLTQKIKDSENYSTNLKLAIAEQKDLIESLQKSQNPDKLKINLAKQNLAEKRNELKSEQEYARKLKANLKDLKVKREGSKVEVPLGREADTRQGQRRSPAITQPKQPIMGKKQAAKRSDILKVFRKAFNDPIRLGKFRQRALGIHKGWPKVSRLLNDNDVETAAHEIGHNLHYTLYGGEAKTAKEMRANTVQALTPYLKELKELAHYEPYTLEGFAEFTRMYVTNPDAAKALAPKFYAKFENDLDSRFPELKNALIEAREYYDTYLEGTPESRIDAQLNFAQDQKKLNNIIEWIKTNLNLDNLKTQFLDDVFPAKRLVAEAFGIPLSEVESLKDEKNLYRSLRVLKGAVGKGDVFLRYETFDPDTLEKTGEGLRDILKDLPDDTAYREFNRFLVARRAIEKHGQQIETGINQGDALQVYNDYKDKYGQLAKRLDAYNDQLLQYAQKSGLLSEEQYKEIKRNNLAYAPFQRVMTPEKSDSGASSGGKIQAGKPIKRMKGSTRDIIAPLESVIKNTYAIIINSEKNRAGQVLGKLAGMQNVGKFVEKVPMPLKLQAKISKKEVLSQMERELKKMGWFGDVDVGSEELKELAVKLANIMPDFFMRFGAGTYPAGENIVTVFYEGKPSYYEASPDIYEMWSKGMAPYTSNLLTKILRAPARLLRAGAILNPKFIQKNFIRDTWGSFLFTKYGKSIKDPAGLFIDTLYQPFAMLAQAAKKSPLYVEWLKSGGGMSTMQSLDREAVLKHIEEVKRAFKPHQILKMLRAVAEISEEANRLVEFSKALEVEGKTRLGREIAAFAARDLSIDFAKMGLQTKALNQIIPFFNATIQGVDKFIRTLNDPNARPEFIARTIGYVIIPSLIFAWLNQDDEDIKELQEQEKDFNFLTKIGNKILKIPVPFETGVLANGLTQRMYRYFVDKDPQAFEGFMGSIIDATLPTFIPSFANPFIEAQANKNFFTGGRIIPGAKEHLTSKYQYKNNTSLTARLLGRAINYMIGEDTRSKAASPAIIDHFITSWTGGLGRLMVSISDASLEAVGLGDKIPKIEQTIPEKLGLDAFIARYPRSNTKSIEKFYDYYQDAMARINSKQYAQKLDLEDAYTLDQAEERITKLYDVRTLKRAFQAIQMCQREINNIMIDPNIDSDEKKSLVDELYFQMIDFAKVANQEILDHRKD